MPHVGDDPVADPRHQKDQRTNYSADLSEHLAWLNRAALARATDRTSAAAAPRRPHDRSFAPNARAPSFAPNRIPLNEVATAANRRPGGAKRVGLRGAAPVGLWRSALGSASRARGE